MEAHLDLFGQAVLKTAAIVAVVIGLEIGGFDFDFDYRRMEPAEGE